MTEYYRLSFDMTGNTARNIQKLLLISAICLDFGNIFVLVDVIFGSLYYLFLMALFIVIATVLRVVSTRLIYSYSYLWNGDVFTIRKCYALKSYLTLELKNANFTLEKYDNNSNDSDIQMDNDSDNSPKDMIKLCKNTTLTRYILTYLDKRYLVALDEYMYALITTKLRIKENNNDLS